MTLAWFNCNLKPFPFLINCVSLRKEHTVVCILVRIEPFSRFWRNHPYYRNKHYLGVFHWEKTKQTKFEQPNNQRPSYQVSFFSELWMVSSDYIRTNMHTTLCKLKFHVSLTVLLPIPLNKLPWFFCRKSALSSWDWTITRKLSTAQKLFLS